MISPAPRSRRRSRSRKALARHQLRGERNQLRKHGARAARKRHRSGGGDCTFAAVDRSASFVGRPGGVGAQRRHPARSRGAGAARVVRRRLSCLHGGERAQPARARMRLRIHLAQYCQPRGGGARRARHHGAAPHRVPQTALSIWEDAPLPELPQLGWCGTCGRAATAWRSRSLPTRSRPCCVRRSSSGRAEPRPSSCRRARADRVIGTLVTAPGIASGAGICRGETRRAARRNFQISTLQRQARRGLDRPRESGH